MEKKYAKGGKLKAFLKRNVYYVIMGVCILAIGAMITVALVTKNNDNDAPVIDGNVTPDDPNDPNDPNDPTLNPNPEEPDPIVFGLPVVGGRVVVDYNMEALVWSNTLKQFQVHNGIDFTGEENAVVCAVYDGTVTAVTYDELNGHVVKIDHGDGLVTVYGSLGEEPLVAVGQKLTKGAALGVIGTSATAEMADGPHVHFMLYKSEKVVSPYEFLPQGDK